MDDVFAELSREVLSGSGLSLNKAFAKMGFKPSFKQVCGLHRFRVMFSIRRLHTTVAYDNDGTEGKYIKRSPRRMSMSIL